MSLIKVNSVVCLNKKGQSSLKIDIALDALNLPSNPRNYVLSNCALFVVTGLVIADPLLAIVRPYLDETFQDNPINIPIDHLQFIGNITETTIPFPEKYLEEKLELKKII